MNQISQSFAYPQNYGPFIHLLENGGYMVLHTSDINEVTYNHYFNSLTNLMVDGIEHPYWHGQGKVRVVFTDGEQCTLTLNDLLINFILWYCPIMINEPISSKYLFWEKKITMKKVVEYLDANIVKPNKTRFSNRYLNNIIATCTDKFRVADSVSLYLADTINLYDDVQLMKACPRYRELLHLDLTGLAIDKVKEVLTDATNEAVNIIENSKALMGYHHCLTSNFRTGEALNKKQFTETYIGIGTQADATGNVIPEIIKTSFINGGLSDIVPLFMEAARARKALILSHHNVGTTGAFARILKLCNMDTFLHQDPDYRCNTKNLEKITITDAQTLYRYNDRYYRFTPGGIEYILKDTDTDLIGKTVYFRSPMTCASHAAGHGICYRCYGDLAYTNSDINVGIIAAELLSSSLTQRLLSAKHLLETVIKKIIWCSDFERFFTVDVNQIILNPGEDYRGYKMILKTDDLITDEDESDSDDISMFEGASSNYYVTEFILETPTGERCLIRSEDSDKMVMTDMLNDIVTRKLNKATDEDSISIDLNTIEGGLFVVVIENSELTKTLGVINNIINKTSVTSSMNRDEILQKFIDTLNEANLELNAVHAEVILSNQIVSTRDMFKRPSWEYENEPYKINALSTQLENHPSVTTSLSYQNVARQLYSAKTFRKHKPSSMDLFFAEFPQELLQTIKVDPTEANRNDVDLYKFMKPKNATPGDKTEATTELINPFIIH